MRCIRRVDSRAGRVNMQTAFMMNYVLLTIVTLIPRVYGINDWSKACLDGTCSFDVQEGPANLGGTLQISGSQTSISDITTAAGWQILNCTDSTNTQTIRLVCADKSLGCDHIFQNGAQDTIVRLPDGCGSGPFVRVANHSIPEDQSIPASVASRLRRRGGATSQVHSLQIDDNFAQMSGVHGNVSFEIHAEGALPHDIAGKANHRKRQNGSASSANAINIPEDLPAFNASLSCPAANGTTEIQSALGSASFLETLNMNISVTASGTLSPPNIATILFDTPTNGQLSMSAHFESNLQTVLELSSNEEYGPVDLPSLNIDGY
ncbi:hypothetical protein SCHPADRAFT_160751 [Schizopora paradoxa]|uniref:Uncharacterized protein n=1 Tax=Schizopora paradoxa TaxID=27342 RepID=A0A0H2S7E4_9AGAM|nr:hypothetical protein SCHPADRAFT_160751 [Schizopora paradoxa]